MEWALAKAQMKELLDAKLVEFSKGEYVSTTILHTKKDIFGNWTGFQMCKDYRPINKQTQSNKYDLSLPKKIFDSIV
jgi:hypothetical protein